MDSLLAIFEKHAPPQNVTPAPTQSSYNSVKKSTVQESRREPAKPAPKEPSRPAPKAPSRPAPSKPAPREAPSKPAPREAPSKPAPREAPSKPAPREATRPAPKEPAKSSQSTPTYQRPMVSKSISMLMEKLTNPIEDEEEEEVPAKPAMPRRQSLGGINVRDLASKHETSRYTPEPKANPANAAPQGHVKPVQMIEVAIPTIQEETEYTEEKRASEVIQESANVANAKIETAQNEASLRDSFAMMMDEFDIDLDDMEEELKSLDIPSTLSSQPTMVEHSSTSAGPNTLNLKTIEIACVPPDKTIPPAPTTAPPPAPVPASRPAPVKPFQGAGAIDNVDFDSIEDLDIDSMVEEINREQEQKKQDEEQQQRESLGKVGYSFTPSRTLRSLTSSLEYHPKQEFVSSGINDAFYDVSNGKEDMSTIELSSLLRRVCDGSVTMRTVTT